MNYRKIYAASKERYAKNKIEILFFSFCALLTVAGYWFVRSAVQEILDFFGGAFFLESVPAHTALLFFDTAALFFFIPFFGGVLGRCVFCVREGVFSFLHDKKRLQRLYRRGFSLLYYFLLCFSPLIFVFFVFETLSVPHFFSKYWYIYFALLVLSIFLCFSLFLSLVKVPYYFVCQKNIGVRDAVKKSRCEMKGKKAEFARLLIAFAPWLLLGMLSGFILIFVYVLPRMGCAYALFCEQSEDRKDLS